MSAAFTQAAEDSKKLVATPTNDELLELYGMLLPIIQPLLPRASSICDARGRTTTFRISIVEQFGSATMWRGYINM